MALRILFKRCEGTKYQFDFTAVAALNDETLKQRK